MFLTACICLHSHAWVSNPNEIAHCSHNKPCLPVKFAQEIPTSTSVPNVMQNSKCRNVLIENSLKITECVCSCSITCWNIHKESNCEKPVDINSIPAADPTPSFYPTDDTVEPAKLELLRKP